MGRKCAVPHCYTGYRKCKEKASLYRVPDDDFFLGKWQEAIAREDRPITPKDYVCEKHFRDDDILRRRVIKDVIEEYQRPRLKPDAVPSIFPDLPEFILKMVKKRRKISASSDTNNIETINSVDNKRTEADEDEHKNDIKEEEEPVSTEATGPTKAPEETCNLILNNEIDIKSEPEEITEQPVEINDDNEKEDPTFGPKMHQCDECDYQTKYPHNLRTHKTKHLTGEEAYLHCKYCPNFQTKWELTYRNHLKIKHGIGKQEVFRCTLCQFETKVKLCLKRHYARHKRDVAQADAKASLDSHIILLSETQKPQTEPTQKSKASFKCTECLYETNSKTHILKHIKTVHNTGDDTGVSVNSRTPTKSKTTHLETQISVPKVKEKPLFKCLKCPYQSTSHAYLLKHVFKHKYPQTPAQKKTKAKIWKCSTCPYATFFQDALVRHKEECGKEIFSCTECSFSSNSKSSLLKHSLVHRNTSIETVNQGNAVNGVPKKGCAESDAQQNIEPLVLVKVEEVNDFLV